MSEIQIGVSACLLGEQVRYDGGHKRNAFLLEELASHVRFVPVCPEPAIGIGASRETMRLVRRGDGVRVWDEGAQRRSRRGGASSPRRSSTPRLAWRSRRMAELALVRISAGLGQANIRRPPARRLLRRRY
jgi:uncharacterized protein YbbK (DUF523 family)